MVFSPYILAGSFVAALVLYLAVPRLLRNTIAYLPGPPPGSWLIGNIPALFRSTNLGDTDFAWIKAYGNSVRIKGVFGSDVLFTTDPKAFQHILHTSCHEYPKAHHFRFIVAMLAGKGVIWAEGAQHSRHRKIMDPAFSYASIRKHLPLFRQTSQRIVAKWKDIVSQHGGISATIDVTSWISRTTLDIIGAAAFDYQLGALDEGAGSELYQAYSNVFIDSFLERSNYTFVLEELCGLAPGWMLSLLLSILPTKITAKLQKTMTVARGVGRSLIDQRLESHAKGEECGKDILSLFVTANLSTRNLTDEEILGNITNLLLAGHETSASTLDWALHEISRHPELQSELRKEIKSMRARAAQRGDTELSATDLDSMKYLTAVVKETLRYHPILPQLMRVAARDDVIPLSTPHRANTGELITGIPVRKGQRILLSIAAFNRMQSLWGEDANIWRPQRFLEENKQNARAGVGVFANMVTFNSGVRTCIGWRFAVLEMQAILVELIENFEFSPAPGVEILRAGALIMKPIVKGSNARREELPLVVTPIA